MPPARDDPEPASAPTSGASDLPNPFGAAEGYEEAAARARIAERLFGAPTTAVRIGRYELLDRIGAGGMGVVYAARDPELGRLVALKLLTSQRSADPRHRQRLIGEAQTLARLSHPNVVQIHEVGEHDGATFLALELIQGETLATWQRRPGRLWPEILAAYAEAARGLAAAHEVGVVHRDVKPSNILIGADGRARVVDFGLARAGVGESQTTSIGDAPHQADLSSTGTIAGTPAYMSPEQARGTSVDTRTDLFSLCVSLFEGLYSRRPFEAHELRQLPTSGRLAPARLRALVPRGSPVPAWVLPILAAGLEPDLRHRTGDLRSLLAELERAPRRRRRRHLLAGAVVGLALAGWGLDSLVAARPTCPALVDTIPGAWDPARKQAIHARFIASQLPFAEDAWRHTERALDAAVLAWGRERRASCLRTHVERSQSDEQFDLSAECLASHERTLRDLLDRLAEAGPAEVTQAHVLVRELDVPAECTDIDVLRRGPAAPVSAVVRERVAVLRGELDEIRVLIIIAELTEAAARADALVEAATIHPPLHAEAVFLRGIIAARSGAIADADRRFSAAVTEAEEHRDDRLAAAVLGEQTELATQGHRDLPRARAYAELYGAKLRRIAADAAARAEHLDRLGELELIAGDPAAALAHHEQSQILHASDDLVGRARSIKGAANALAELGRSAESIERLQAARDLFARELGELHQATALVDFDIALGLRERTDRTPEDLERAESLLRRALALELRRTGSDSLDVARVRTALAYVLQDRGAHDAAVAELDLGLPILRNNLPPTHPDVANALALAINLHIERRAWGPAADACTALIRLHRARGEPIPLDLLINAGEFLLRQGQAAAATAYFDQALTVAASDEPPEPLYLAHALNGRGKIYLAQADPTMARALFDRASPLLALVNPPSPLLTAEVQWGAAQALTALRGDPQRARELAEQALAAFHIIDPDAPEIATIAAFLATRDSSRRR